MKFEDGNSLPTDDADRGEFPMADGLIDYFPNALAEVSRISKRGSEKHNVGEEMHWARGKSTDHRNKIIRHTVDSKPDTETAIEHAAQAAWRALAHLQEKIERVRGAPMSRGSRGAKFEHVEAEVEAEIAAMDEALSEFDGLLEGYPKMRGDREGCPTAKWWRVNGSGFEPVNVRPPVVALIAPSGREYPVESSEPDDHGYYVINFLGSLLRRKENDTDFPNWTEVRRDAE